MGCSIEDLPVEVLYKNVFANLNPISVSHCSETCVKWKEIVAFYIYNRFLQKFAAQDQDLKRKLYDNGWTEDSNDCGLIIDLYQKFKHFKGMHNIFSINLFLANLKKHPLKIAARILITTGLESISEYKRHNKIIEIIDLFNPEASFGFNGSGTDPTLRCIGSTGAILDGQPVICGGAKNSALGIYEMFQYIKVVDNPAITSIDMIQDRSHSASVVLGKSSLWITGGVNFQQKFLLKSSEIVTLGGDPIKGLSSEPGPELPFTIYYHGMVKIDAHSIYIIGEKQDGMISKNVWIVDPTDGYSIKKGPSLKTSRYGFSCGKIEIAGNIIP